MKVISARELLVAVVGVFAGGRVGVFAKVAVATGTVVGTAAGAEVAGGLAGAPPQLVAKRVIRKIVDKKLMDRQGIGCSLSGSMVGHIIAETQTLARSKSGQQPTVSQTRRIHRTSSRITGYYSQRQSAASCCDRQTSVGRERQLGERVQDDAFGQSDGDVNLVGV